VIPVVTIEDATARVDLAGRSSAAASASVEITLRTTSRTCRDRSGRPSCPEVVVGAGTVLSPADLSASAQAAPALPSRRVPRASCSPPRGRRRFLSAGHRNGNRELMQGLDAGYQCFKFFPAGALGGAAALRALVAPFPKVLFCRRRRLARPTRATTLRSAMCPVSADPGWRQRSLRAKDWRRIETLAARGCRPALDARRHGGEPPAH